MVGHVIAAPHPAPTADGRVHLVYEINLQNAGGATVTLEQVEILDAGRRNAVVGSLTGTDLQAALRRFAGQTGTALTVELERAALPGRHLRPQRADPRAAHPPRHDLARPGADRCVAAGDHLSVRSDRRGARHARSRSRHRSPARAGWSRAAAARRRATTAPPCCRSTASLHDAQRFAIDFVQLEEDGRLFSGPANELSSYKYFGAPIHAVADGVVVKLLDGEPEQTPGGFPELPIDKIDGNFVVMDIGNGHYAFYAHFQAGLKVRLGQRVRQGQVLGRLGNTGNSDGPHLHFHVMDGPSPLGSNGLPYTFTKFRSAGFVTNQEETPAGVPAIIDPNRLAGTFWDVLPSDRQVVVFRPIAGEHNG